MVASAVRVDGIMADGKACNQFTRKDGELAVEVTVVFFLLATGRLKANSISFVILQISVTIVRMRHVTTIILVILTDPHRKKAFESLSNLFFIFVLKINL